MFNKILTITFVLAVIATAFMYINTTKADIVKKGLIHYWSFDNIMNDIAEDHVGGNDVEIIRGDPPELLGGKESDPQIIDGKFRKALEFDGDGDYAQSTEEIEISGQDPRTLSAWVRWNTKSDQFHVAVGFGWEGETNQICNGELFCITTWGGNAITMWGVCNDHKTTVSAEPGTWYYVSMVYDDQMNLEIYVDGNSEYEASTNLNTGEGTRLTLGKKIFTFADRTWANCAVDEVSIYDRPLSGAEVKQNLKSSGWAVNPANKLSVTWGDIKVSR